MANAPVNKILPYSVVDGKGSRVAVFLQKCNIKCAYCHNPETQNMCIHCGICVPACQYGALQTVDKKVVWNPQKCVNCDACIAACPHYASPKIKDMSAAAVFEKVKESMPFIRGITVSGGECGLYPAFLTELFTLAQEQGLSCFMDTNGTIDLSLYPSLMEVCSGVMLDVKAWDPDVFFSLTQGDNFAVKQNLSFLFALNKLEELRIVVVPGKMDAKAAILGIQRQLGRKNVRGIPLKLISFRPYGVKGDFAQLAPPSKSEMDVLYRLAADVGFEDITVI
ncbi:YjjW family glycine radical enzyme activase [Oscillospiraceae bacterium MB08-C2-2]|nr:YjjW family glycine radical enzyme activase [Oscillospiraceae bacterium MB08-C2-2]